MTSAGTLRRDRYATVGTFVGLAVLVPLLVTAVYRVADSPAPVLALLACLAVGLAVRHVPQRGAQLSWLWLGACAFSFFAFVIWVILFSGAFTPIDGDQVP